MITDPIMMERASRSPVLTAVVQSIPNAFPKPEHADKLAHHVSGGKKFTNPWDSFQQHGSGTLLWATIRHWWNQAEDGGPQRDEGAATMAIRKPTFLPTRETPRLRTTWLGHACFLAEFPGGLRVLFDPVFTERCSPFDFLGPKRFTKMPCQIEDIPFIDAVVISHNHYDHLSHPTIKEIQRLHPECHFFAPLGNKQWFDEIGVKNSTELDWWQSARLSLVKATGETGKDSSPSSTTGAAEIEATIGCLPSQHFSSRGLFDRYKTLWGSWSIESGGKKLWFAGDTGYRSVPDLPATEDDYGEKHDHLPRNPEFAEIGKLRGPFDLGLIPIGAYQPRFSMSPVHANPVDSVNIFTETKCKTALGMHWGTWVLTQENVQEPPRLLQQALKKYGYRETGVFDVCEVGESREFA